MYFVFSILLHFGASVDCIDHKGFTPLHYAVKSGSLQVIIELIEKGADVNHRAKWKLEFCKMNLYFVNLCRREKLHKDSYTYTSNVHTQDLNDFIYSAQMKGLHQFHIILQSTYMKFSYTRHIPSYTLQQCTSRKKPIFKETL